MTHDQADTATAKKVVRLPEPDTENITVLTHELPNEPILPWHRYDSPWLDADGKVLLLDTPDAPVTTEEIVEAAVEEVKVTGAQSALPDPDLPESPEAIAPSGLPDPDDAESSTQAVPKSSDADHLSHRTD
ncbi:MAG: hypothetical protein IGR80_16450 [Synechococcales cyanobacterium K44_A2020_017]|nr:hypothetical protein [Synechococcales cyanobacterium K32_A2020_035]MBF2096329.1 hypothetical protein [Synechococcales cyanobacterium K44_A2020_017]